MEYPHQGHCHLKASTSPVILRLGDTACEPTILVKESGWQGILGSAPGPSLTEEALSGITAGESGRGHASPNPLLAGALCVPVENTWPPGVLSLAVQRVRWRTGLSAVERDVHVFSWRSCECHVSAAPRPLLGEQSLGGEAPGTSSACPSRHILGEPPRGSVDRRVLPSCLFGGSPGHTRGQLLHLWPFPQAASLDVGPLAWKGPRESHTEPVLGVDLVCLAAVRALSHRWARAVTVTSRDSGIQTLLCLEHRLLREHLRAPLALGWVTPPHAFLGRAPGAPWLRHGAALGVPASLSQRGHHPPCSMQGLWTVLPGCSEGLGGGQPAGAGVKPPFPGSQGDEPAPTRRRPGLLSATLEAAGSPAGRGSRRAPTAYSLSRCTRLDAGIAGVGEDLCSRCRVSRFHIILLQ